MKSINKFYGEINHLLPPPF